MRTLDEIRAGFLALPGIGIEPWLGGRRPLVLAPHPDDESLGCGGMIAGGLRERSGAGGGGSDRWGGVPSGSRAFPPARLRDVREAEAARATAMLGLPARHLHFLRQADTRLAGGGPDFEALVERIAGLGRRAGCGLVVGPWAGDPHCDHEAAALLAAAVAARGGWALRSYPVWGWLRDGAAVFDEPRIGGWRLDIARHQQAKQRAIEAHVSQYGGLITDSPAGFRLPAALLAVFARPYEVFIE